MIGIVMFRGVRARVRAKPYGTCVGHRRPRLPTGPGGWTRHDCLQSRPFVEISTIVLPPVVFGGLVVALWTWKCLMMVVFQNKIIYMPGLPPNARRERIEDYRNQCSDIQWWEEKIKSVDGTQISLCVATVTRGSDHTMPKKMVYILYFQGNASSIPPRLPYLSPILRTLRDRPSASTGNVRYTMVCCSYRGYWTSRGRPSEIGIAMDAVAALRWVNTDGARKLEMENAPNDSTISVVIWGQSIGAGICSNLASRKELFMPPLDFNTLILETPFLSIRAMLQALYPQKWLPYRYLWPFLQNHLDSWKELGIMKGSFQASGVSPPRILILQAGSDELVPKSHADELEARCINLGLNVEKKVISGALHPEVMAKSTGRLVVVEAIEKAAKVDRVIGS